MNEFNLDLAKKGEPVKTRDGHQVRLICFDRLHNNHGGSLIGLMLGQEKKYETILQFDTCGRFIDHDKNRDLIMVNDYD